MSDERLGVEFDIDWSRFPGLARTFEHRPLENDLWKELMGLFRVVVMADRAARTPDESPTEAALPPLPEGWKTREWQEGWMYRKGNGEGAPSVFVGGDSSVYASNYVDATALHAVLAHHLALAARGPKP